MPLCGKRLTGGDVGFEGRHYPPAAILLALSLFAIGNSPTSICTTLSTNLNIVVHRTTIQRWVDCYMTLIDLYTKSLLIRTGGKWSTDEKYIRILGKEPWLFTVLDCYTRFVLACKIGIKKDRYNATKMFREAVNRAGCLPVIFCSDSLPSYRKACQKVFNKKRGTKVIHWCDCHLRDIFRNNNMQERANSTFDELIRTRRGPKSENSILFVDAILHYNFIRPHSGIDNKTPAAAANIIINGYNTGHTLIQNAILSA